MAPQAKFFDLRTKLKVEFSLIMTLKKNSTDTLFSPLHRKITKWPAINVNESSRKKLRREMRQNFNASLLHIHKKRADQSGSLGHQMKGCLLSPFNFHNPLIISIIQSRHDHISKSRQKKSFKIGN